MLLVRSGTYSRFTLSAKGLTILGSNSVVHGAAGSGTIKNTSTAQPVVVSRMVFNGDGLQLLNCAGPAFIDSLTVTSLETIGCADVRGHLLSTTSECVVTASE